MKASMVLGIFDDFGCFLRSLREAKRMGVVRISTYTPIPCHEVEEILEERPSPIRFFTLAGGLFGFAAGAALTVICPMAYPLIVGGKPLISVPPNLVIAFELTILFASIVSTIGYFLLSPYRGPSRGRLYDPSFSEDRFGVLVACDPIDLPRFQTMMKRNGARETRIRE